MTQGQTEPQMSCRLERDSVLIGDDKSGVAAAPIAPPLRQLFPVLFLKLSVDTSVTHGADEKVINKKKRNVVCSSLVF